MSVSHETTQLSGEDDGTRRDFIHLMAGMAAVGAGVGVAVPLVNQMNPDASVRALATKEVAIDAIEPGQVIKVMWQGKPVFVRRRTQAEIAAADATPVAVLKDKIARNDNIASNAPATDADRTIRPEWVIVVGVCTHLGCIPLGPNDTGAGGDYKGWFCPCHGSHYDNAGRIRKGPAPQNLLVPKYEFLSDTMIKIG